MMPIIVKKIMSELERSLNCGKKVIIYDLSDKKLFISLIESIEKYDLKNIEIWHCMEDISEDTLLRQISLEDMGELLNTYRLYDFSDKVTVLSEYSQYASMKNYIKESLITPEEMLFALLTY